MYNAISCIARPFLVLTKLHIAFFYSAHDGYRDGGLVANNPVRTLLTKLVEDELLKDKVSTKNILSVGTGCNERKEVGTLIFFFLLNSERSILFHK